jgi:hypothetical protein
VYVNETRLIMYDFSIESLTFNASYWGRLIYVFREIPLSYLAREGITERTLNMECLCHFKNGTNGV